MGYAILEGEFERSKLNGYGSLRYYKDLQENGIYGKDGEAHGEFYTGEFKNGVPHGKGEIVGND